jgi:hypothetical protein
VKWIEQDVVDYYRHPAVVERMREYGRGSCGIAAYGGREHLATHDQGPIPVPTDAEDRVLRGGADLCRSLADTRGVLLHLDIDYVDPLRPAAPYDDPTRVFRELEPIYETAVHAFRTRGISPLTLLTGRGYHVMILVRRGTRFYERLVAVGALDAPLAAKYEEAGHVLPSATTMGRAHAGAGRLLEHLAHDVIRRLRRRSVLPVAIADTPPAGKRPFACLDLSAHGDPLFERHLRSAFSLNQKARRRGAHDGVVVVLPRGSVPLAELLEVRQSLAAAARLAGSVSVEIPEAAPDDGGWVRSYVESPLGRFHRFFDAGTHVPWRDWPVSYDAIDLAALPRCVSETLRTPNPLLLEPSRLRLVTLVLWSLGYPPRWIAGLIRSKYERDFGWGATWYRYDAAARADFYVRLFCGAQAMGLERESPLDCGRLAAAGLCPGRCRFDLERVRRLLPRPGGRPWTGRSASLPVSRIGI